ncbi:MAG: hypothetical protein J4G13_09445 [Dehalococcoidia bacterium]|nr:hypothetical protein [Dehalococcoidia bacterium]
MNKLSITLPLGAQVSIESDDPELVREVLYSFMPQLIGSNGETPAPALPTASGPPVSTNGHSHENGVAYERPAEKAPEPMAAVPQGDIRPAVVVQQVTAAPLVAAPQSDALNGGPNGANPTVRTTPDQLEFMAFCQRVNPLGDMRKVVVAAEAAHRYLNIVSVDPDELERLFTLIGWPIPHSFVQTLRNAARTKFRWLERIPGKSGHYKVTNTGRSIVLGENLPSLETAPSQSEADGQD